MQPHRTIQVPLRVETYTSSLVRFCQMRYRSVIRAQKTTGEKHGGNQRVSSWC